jgi:[NiFe] hydrogenase small subunit
MECARSLEERLEQQGITRRDFLKFFAMVAGALGLDPSFGPKIMEALAATQRPPVLWLHFAECTGCTEAVLRTTSPWFDDLIFNTISLDYHETLMAAAGDTVESLLTAAANLYSGKFFCVVEGAIPTANRGVYGMIGGRTMLSIAQEICPKAKAIVAIGTCASYGGLAAGYPNPTGARGVKQALGSGLTVPVVNVPGCPPNPVSVVGTLANYLLFGKLPALDLQGRPLFAYGKKVHEQCPYRENGGGHDDRCLEDMGCKGKQCYNNCPSVQFNDGTSWPVRAGHPCIGCSEPNFWDRMTPFYSEIGEHFSASGSDDD